MIRMQTYGKRSLAMVMALLMLFSCINSGLYPFTTARAVEKESVTDGELLVNNYELSDAVEALLLSGLLKEETYVYEVNPTSDDGLVEVDGANKTITANIFERAGFVWHPTEAKVINGGVTETVALKDVGGKYMGTFKTEGNTYSVQVTYELYIEIPTERQENLLNAGANFKTSLDSLDQLAQLVTMLDTKPADTEETGRQLLSRIMDSLLTWVDGIAVPVMPGTLFYYPGGFTPDNENSEPIRVLADQMHQNNGSLDLFVMLDEYYNAESKTQYLIENGNALLAKAEETADYLEQILAVKNTVLSMLDLGTGMGVQLGIDRAELEDFYSSLNIVVNGGEHAGIKFAGLNALTVQEWAVLSNNPLKDNMTAAEYKVLDQLVKNVSATAPVVTISEKLLAASASVQVNMNRYDITVKVAANVVERNTYDSTELKNLVSGNSVKITLNKGATYSEVMAAIQESNVIPIALADWYLAYQVGDVHYTQTIIGMGAQDVVESDMTITFLYTPKTYTVSGFDGVPASVPYGYNLTLPTHPDVESKRVYDYEIGGISYRQGSVYRIVGDTQIIRTEGESWVDSPWGEAVAPVVSDKAAVVLKSSALNTGVLSIRYPALKVVTQKVNLDGSTTVRAVTADSGIEGLLWVPSRAYYVCGNQKFEITDFASDSVAGTGSFTALDYDKVVVEYELVLNGIIPDADMLALLNLPAELAKQAKEQKETMTTFSSMKGALGQLAEQINVLKVLLDTDMVTPEGKVALRVLVDECYNTQTKKMFIQEYLDSFDAAGLVWYYSGSNFETFAAEFDKLKKSMNDFLNATPDLKELLEEFGYGDKYDMVDGVRSDLNSVELVAPHSAINRNAGSNKLAELVAAIENASENEIYTSLPDVLAKVEREQTAENKRSITLHMNVDGKLSGTYTMVFTVGQALTQNHIDKLVAALAEMNNALTIDKQFYNYTATALPEVGEVVTTNLVLEFSYLPKTVDVVVSGVGTIDTFTVHDSDIILPACGQEGLRYQYVINGQIVDTYNAAITYTLTADQMLFLLNGGQITRITLDVARQNLLDFIASLNNALASKGAIGAMSFIPVEDAQGSISIVLKVSPLVAGFNPQTVLMAVAETIIASDYAYIDMGGYALRTGTPMHIQGIIDALLDTDFTLTDVSNAINSNGTINNMTLAGQTLVTDGIDLSMIPNKNALGGKLMESTLDLATTEMGVRTSVKLYVTLGDTGANASTLSTLDKGLNKVTPYVNIHLVNGSANLVLNLPDKAYQAFLAAMMITGNTELGSVNDLDYGMCVEYLYDLVAPLLWDDSISTDTFENSFAAVNKDVDLAAASKVLKTIQRVLKHIDANVEFSNVGAIGNIYQLDAAYPIDNLLTKLPIPEALLSVIAEKGGNLEATFGVQLKNVDTDYEALIIDVKASAANKITFVTNLTAALKGIHNNSVVILVADTAGNITTDKKIFLDLNGKTVNGDVIGTNITVIDSTLGNSGVITGKITGTDRRSNNMYSVEVDGDNVNVYLNSARWALDEMPEFKNIGLDLALDLVLNYYTAAALELDGDLIYSVDLGDILGMVESGATSSVNHVIDMLKCEGLSNFANKLMADLTDFAKMAEAAKAGDKLFSYTITTRAWDVSIFHDTEKDYISGGIIAGENEKSTTLNIYLGGTDAEKQDIIALMEELGKILDVDLRVDLEDINYADRVVSITGDAFADVVIDTKGNHDYAAALAILLASGRSDNAAIINALEIYFAEGKITALKEIVDNTTVAQLFTAIKKVNRGTNFGALVTKLGLNAEDAYKATNLLVTYRRFLVVASAGLRRLKVTGTGTKLAAYATEGKPGSYDLSKELDRAGTVKVLGYDVELAASLTVVLFGVEPTFNGHEAVVAPGSNILESKVDSEDKTIILDVMPEGITEEEFKELVSHAATNADKVEMEINGVKNGLVVNGATVTFTASNNSTTVVDTITYTVIILGDVNSDGRNTVSDSVALMTHVMQETDLTEKVGAYALIAADINLDGSLSVSDAVMIMRKCMNDHYISVLN